MTKQSHDLKPETVEAIAGGTAGIISTIVAHPLDIIKTRLQLDTTSRPFLNSSRSVLRDILRNEGPTRLSALYRGLTPNLIGNSAGWALYFLWYQQAKDFVRQRRGYSPDHKLNSVEILSTSAVAGALSAICTNPIWVVKTRMLSTSATTEGAYSGTLPALASIWRKEGLRGYFHGLTPALFGVTHGAIYFLVYENLKVWRISRNKGKELTNADTTFASAVSKVFAGAITYPSQVVRSRLQSYDPRAAMMIHRKGLVGVIMDLWRNEGFLGFYKGIVPNLARIVPSTCITFLVYENVKWALPRMYNENQNLSKSGSTL